MSERTNRSDTWADAGQDGVEEQQVKSLSPEEAQAWRERHPSVSPWRVVRFQALVGVVVALATWAVMRDLNALWSALYGAGVVVLPGAVMARGITSRLSSTAPGSGAIGFMVWELVKLLVSVSLLVLAPRLLPHLSWPALLVALVLCLKTYWVALLWRGR